ncbi:MAG: glycosyltransferase family 4 protein [Acidobacteriota bacterium]
MKICFLVDARSPIARNWIGYFVERDHEVHIISSYPCSTDDFLPATLHQTPVAFANFSRASKNKKLSATIVNDESLSANPPISESRKPGLANWQANLTAKLSLAVQHCLLPFDVERHVSKIARLFEQLSPDLIHAMRIPFEGILAAKAAPAQVPLLISVWGNDFTLWASRNPLIAGQTVDALKRADALHTDCQRDLQMAIRDWQFASHKPAIILPGAGGIRSDLFYAGEVDESLQAQLNICADAPVVMNPRGIRGYVRNDVFFEAIPLALEQFPQTIFLGVAMQGNAFAENYVRKLRLENNVRLLPTVTSKRLAELFRLSQIVLSPSLHDGTPNTLLEAMACGCFPVAGDIASVREWIVSGANGLLCDANDKRSVADALIRALRDAELRDSARAKNLQLIGERADYNQVMQQAEDFYKSLIRQHKAK